LLPPIFLRPSLACPDLVQSLQFPLLQHGGNISLICPPPHRAPVAAVLLFFPSLSSSSRSDLFPVRIIYHHMLSACFVSNPCWSATSRCLRFFDLDRRPLSLAHVWFSPSASDLTELYAGRLPSIGDLRWRNRFHSPPPPGLDRSYFFGALSGLPNLQDIRFFPFWLTSRDHLSVEMIPPPPSPLSFFNPGLSLLASSLLCKTLSDLT